MECRCADNHMTPLISISRITSANGRFDRLSRHTERFIRCESLARLAIPICITKLQGKGQDAIAVVQQVGCEIRSEFLRTLWDNPVAPDHGARHPASQQPSSSLRSYQAREGFIDNFRIFRHDLRKPMQ